MSAPVFTTTQTVYAMPLGQEFSIQLAASNSPTGWSVASGTLPSGVILDLVNGLLHGSGTMTGTWTFQIKASNADGDGVGTILLGIYDTDSSDRIVKKATINTDTWAVTFLDTETYTENAVSVTAAGGIRYRDTVTFDLRFTNSSGALLYPPLHLARMSLKGLDTEAAFIVTGVLNFRKAAVFEGTGYVKRFFLVASFSSDSLLAFLEESETDSGTWRSCLCEFEFLFKRHEGAGTGYLDRITTRPFVLKLTRDTVL